MTRNLSRNILAILGSLIVLAILAGIIGDIEKNRQQLISLILVVLGGGMAIAIIPSRGSKVKRFLTGALVASLVGNALIMIALPSPDGFSIGYLLGNGVGNWAIIGGSLALVLRAFPKEEK